MDLCVKIRTSQMKVANFIVIVCRNGSFDSKITSNILIDFKCYIASLFHDTNRINLSDWCVRAREKEREIERKSFVRVKERQFEAANRLTFVDSLTSKKGNLWALVLTLMFVCLKS